MCTTFMCKQHKLTDNIHVETIQTCIWHSCLNDAHDINVQIIQIDEW
jgi:hypothetical protein